MKRGALKKTAKDFGVKRASDQSDAQLRDACKLAAAGATVLAPDSARGELEACKRTAVGQNRLAGVALQTTLTRYMLTRGTAGAVVEPAVVVPVLDRAAQGVSADCSKSTADILTLDFAGMRGTAGKAALRKAAVTLKVMSCIRRRNDQLREVCQRDVASQTVLARYMRKGGGKC